MSKRRLAFFSSLCLCLGLVALFISTPAFASSGSACNSPGSGGSGGGNCDNCINSFMYQNIASGNAIITAMFTTIDNVLTNVEYSFFNGIVGNTTFQQVIGTGMVLYVAMYGMMIMFNLSSYKIGEVVTRLIKVAIVYMITAPGAWGAFNTWVQTPVIGGINQIIREFNAVAESGSTVTISLPNGSGSSFGASGSGDVSGGAPGLDPTAFASMFGSSMTTVFSAQIFTAIIGMANTGFFGWLISLFLLWALVEFMLMVLGALITYAQAIIGLAFLFGVAPIFFIFLLFEKTRQIFFVWLSQVITFALEPILLFAFLSFYVAIINEAVPYLLTDPNGVVTDFCWTKWFSMPGSLWEVYTWHPTSSGAVVGQGWYDISGTQLKEPINVPNAIYFLMLCHLAKTFTGYIHELAQDLGEGMGTSAPTVQAMEANVMQSAGNLFNKVRGKGS
jgi:type IV secretory pathway VirB6-like protein